MEFLDWAKSNLDFFILLTLMVGGMTLLIYWHLDKSNRFDLRDLLIDSQTKLLSLYKIGQVMALIVSTWIVVHETRGNRLSDLFFLSYISIWSGVNLLNNYMGKQLGNSNLSVLNSTTSTTTVNQSTNDAESPTDSTTQQVTTDRKRVFDTPKT